MMMKNEKITNDLNTYERKKYILHLDFLYNIIYKRTWNDVHKKIVLIYNLMECITSYIHHIYKTIIENLMEVSKFCISSLYFSFSTIMFYLENIFNVYLYLIFLIFYPRTLRSFILELYDSWRLCSRILVLNVIRK